MSRPGQAESLKYQIPDTPPPAPSLFTEPVLPVRLLAFAPLMAAGGLRALISFAHASRGTLASLRMPESIDAKPIFFARTK
jgi:hypothetical protein